ncbi:MAG: hypothetical protein JWO82_1586 [Akkermansiaceae bacterium]|nr:hypothetical protein [Akkermansiaceae bacterium]
MNGFSAASLVAVAGLALIPACLAQQSQGAENQEAQPPQRQPAPQTESKDGDLIIHSVFGRGFGKVFKQEMILEKGSYVPGTKQAEYGKPFWVAHLAGSANIVRVQGHSADIQKKIEEWANLRPDKPVKVIAYETISADGEPGLTAEVKNGEGKIPIGGGLGWNAAPRLIVFDLLP